jgi:hypothetical protein
LIENRAISSSESFSRSGTPWYERLPLRSTLKRATSSSLIGTILPSASNSGGRSPACSGVTSRRNAATFSASSTPLRS